mgnify:CR=1 FL=1
MLVDLSSFPVIIDSPVRWGDMDAFGHVNNVVFFQYFESARIAYLEKINYQQIFQQTNVSIILASVDCKFILPLFYPDFIQIGAKVTDVQADRFIMDYAIFSTSQNKIAAIGSSNIVTYDYKLNKKAPVPTSYKFI